MGQHQAGMLEPELSPEQQVKIKGAGPPALLALAIASAALFQALQLLKQLQCRQLRRQTPNLGEQKHGIAVRVLAWRTTLWLGRQKRRTTHILSISITPIHEKLSQAGSDPPEGGFRRPMAAAQVGPKPNGER